MVSRYCFNDIMMQADLLSKQLDHISIHTTALHRVALTSMSRRAIQVLSLNWLQLIPMLFNMSSK